MNAEKIYYGLMSALYIFLSVVMTVIMLKDAHTPVITISITIITYWNTLYHLKRYFKS
jgi:hypothetical protein